MNNKINKQHLNDFRRFMCDKGFKLVPTIRDFEISRLEDENRTIVIYAGLADSSCFHVKDVDSFYVEDYYSQARVIEQDCEACTDGNPCEITNKIEFKDIGEIGDFKMIKDNDLYYIDFQGQEVEFGETYPINYCPMCGRKLGD